MDRMGIFGAVEPVHARAAGIGAGGVSAIERGFQVRGEAIEGGCVRPGHTLRGHRAHAQLANHLLPCLGPGRNFVEIRILKRQAAGAQFIVMAGYAVLIENGLLPLRLGIKRRHCRFGERRSCGPTWVCTSGKRHSAAPFYFFLAPSLSV